MIKLLPFILIPALIVGALGYWRFVSIKQSFTPSSTTVDIQPVEIPKTLPNATLDDRVKSLEDLISKLVTQVNGLKSTSGTVSNAALDTRLKTVEAGVTDLTARVSALEKSSPAQPAAASSQSVVYIPLGSGGGPWGNQGWYSTPEYQITLDPANYPGYTGMYLEVTFRLTQRIGTASVRLYNSTDNTVTSSQVDTTSDSYTTQTSSSFKLPTGAKNYNLQVKSTDSINLLIQTARIRVNF